MPMPCDGGETLAVRVMDYDWGKKDDMLGECAVQLGDLLAGGQPVSMPLYRKGRGGEFGEVTLSAARGAAGLVVLRCHQATGLRKGDWFGKNDVYVQAYVVHRTADPSADALPEPDKNVELPAGRLETVFGFTIPAVDDLPPSAEGPLTGADYASVGVPRPRRFSRDFGRDRDEKSSPSCSVGLRALLALFERRHQDAHGPVDAAAHHAPGARAAAAAQRVHASRPRTDGAADHLPVRLLRAMRSGLRAGHGAVRGVRVLRGALRRRRRLRRGPGDELHGARGAVPRGPRPADPHPAQAG